MRLPARPRIPRLGRSYRLPLVASFGAISLVFTLGLGVLLAVQTEKSINSRSVRELKRTTASAVALTVNLIVNGAPRASNGAPVSVAEQLAEIHLITSASQVLLKTGDVVGAEAALANGKVIGGAGGLPPGAQLHVDADFSSALAGRTRLRTLHRADPGDADPAERRLLTANGDLLLLEEGVRTAPNQPILVVVRVYAALGPIHSQAAADIRATIFVLAIGLLVFWAVVFRLVLQASRRLTRQSRANAHLATHDSMTGLPNRVLLRDRVQQAIAASTRTGAHVALVLMDLDRFREINDTLGHTHGDTVLKLIGPRLRERMREADTIARVGGDEFVILLPDLPSPEVALLIAWQLAEALREPFVVDGIQVDVGSSMGISFTPDHGDDFDQLLQRADIAMFVAKQDSLGAVVFSPEFDSYSPSRLALLGELRRAVDEPDEIVLHYQPKADLPSGTVSGVEALVRWQHPEHGLLSPDRFIPLAEQTGVIRPLTYSILRKALVQNSEWARDGLLLRTAVNISARCLLDVSFPDEVARLLLETGVPAERLELELTESAIMTNLDRALKILEALAASGIRLAIDDFGTGYSSMAYLKKLPIHVIKIDRTFVTEMAHDPSDAAIVRSSLQLARNLNLDVVAEGVETAEVWEQLSDLGCDSLQGYFLARPLPAADVAEWLANYMSPALQNTSHG